MWKKTIAIIVILVLFVGIYFLFRGPSFQVTVLESKPTLKGEYLVNPDLLFERRGFMPNVTTNTLTVNNLTISERVINDTYPWEGNGLYFKNYTKNAIVLGIGRYGVVLIYPPRYMRQTVTLPKTKDKIFLVVGLANLDDVFSEKWPQYFEPSKCADNLFKIFLIEGGKRHLIFQKEINREDGWKDYAIDISDMKGKKVTIRIEGLTGGKCGKNDWEFGTVDYVDVLTEKDL